MLNETEIKMKQNFSRRSTKLFCFSFISAARTCETMLKQTQKVAAACLAGFAVDLIVRLRPRACLPAWAGAQKPASLTPILLEKLKPIAAYPT